MNLRNYIMHWLNRIEWTAQLALMERYLKNCLQLHFQISREWINLQRAKVKSGSRWIMI